MNLSWLRSTQFIKRCITGFTLLSLFTISFFYLPVFILSSIFAAIAAWILLYELPHLVSAHQLTFYVCACLYVIPPFVLFILLYESSSYRILLWYLFIIVALHDTGAYLAGNICGKHKLASFISPGKTWEGALGGLIATMLCIIGIVLYNTQVFPSPINLLAMSVIISLLATIGDLFESWLKRNARIKDSGSLLPGHGGLLDRFDSSMAVIFFFYFYKDFLLRFFTS